MKLTLPLGSAQKADTGNLPAIFANRICPDNIDCATIEDTPGYDEDSQNVITSTREHTVTRVSQ